MSLNLNAYQYDEPEEKSDFITLPAGKPFPFTIVEINEIKMSKAGNPMIPLKLEFDGGPLGKTTVYEYLVFHDNIKRKIDGFLKCVAGEAIKAGKKVNFEDSAFIDWLKRRTGTATLKVEPVQGKTYDRNVLDAYIYEGTSKDIRKAEAPPEPADQGDDFDPDNIPF